VTPARAAAGQAPPNPAAPAPRPAAPPAAAPARAAGIPSTTLPPRTAAGAAAAARVGDPYDDDDDDGRSPARVTLAIIAGVLVVIVLAVLLVTQILGGNDSPTPAAPNTIAQPATSTPATGSPAAAPVNRSATTVFVQNGTRINGAARGAANRLETRGYKIGGTATAVDQTLAATRVAYTQGHRREALDVAKLLAVSAANVTGAGPNDAVAGGNADVVVTIGLDKAQ
jgi:hypothetical protein